MGAKKEVPMLKRFGILGLVLAAGTFIYPSTASAEDWGRGRGYSQSYRDDSRSHRDYDRHDRRNEREWREHEKHERREKQRDRSYWNRGYNNGYYSSPGYYSPGRYGSSTDFYFSWQGR